MSNLPERYAYAVTRLLPPSQRKEVADELLATIDDMAADHAKNGKPTEADITAVLTELGDPTVLADKYKTSPRYLIGPTWFNPYHRLMKTLLCIVPAMVAAVLFAINLASNQSVITATIQGIGSGIAVGIQIAFWVTLVFAIFERVAKPQDIKELNDSIAWNPSQLPHIPKHPEQQVSTAESVTAVVFIALSMAWVALSQTVSAKDGVPLLTPQLWEFWIPLFFALAGLTLAHRLWLLKVSNWTTPLMVTNLLLCAASALYVVAIATTQQIINIEYFHAWGITAATEDLAGIVQWSTAITVAALVANYIWEAVRSVMLNRERRRL